MQLLQPAYLFLLLLLPALWFLPRGRSGRRHAILRAAVFALIILALARPVRVGPDGLEHHVFVVDLTASTSPVDAASRIERVAQLAASLPEEHRATLVLLEEDPTPLSEPTRRPFVAIETVHADQASPLGRTLASAARTIPDGSVGAVTLVTDGLATWSGDDGDRQSLIVCGRAHLLEDVKADEYRLEIAHASRVMPWEEKLAIRAGWNEEDIDLPITIIAGRITDAQGEPVAGALVSAERSRETESGGQRR